MLVPTSQAILVTISHYNNIMIMIIEKRTLEMWLCIVIDKIENT